MPKESKTYKIDFDNGDGTVDEWVFENGRVIQVTVNIRRKQKK